MKISINHTRVRLLFALVVVALAVLGIVILSGGREVDAGSAAPYNQEEMGADKTFRYEISTYRRFSILAAQIAADPSIDVHPEYARLAGFTVADSDGEFSSGRSTVHDQNRTPWYTTDVGSDGTATVTNHRNATIKTEILPASALEFREREGVPAVGQLLEDGGWTRNGSDTFNGQPVEIHEITFSAEGREPASGIELPYVEDLNPVAFKERVMVSSALNLVLKHDRWSVNSDNESVLIETTEILKAKVE